MKRILACGMITLVLCASAHADESKREAGKRPPDVVNVSYGPHARNVLDLWKSKSEKPSPLVVYIHGGGFRNGDKATVSSEMIRAYTAAGISVAAINYRLSDTATFPAQMLDGARAIQFLRHKAREWNIDPKKIGCTGGSAGAGISLWLGFHDDLADPKSSDPVSRQSTRLTCMVVRGAQSSYDPRFIKRVIGGRAHEHPALEPFYGLKSDELDTPKAHKLYEEASPINYVSAGDPPAFLFYTEANKPLAEDAPPGKGIHHPKFGEALQKKMEPLNIECVLRHAEDYRGRRQDAENDMLTFFQKHFSGEK